jgi:hypothetical protein
MKHDHIIQERIEVLHGSLIMFKTILEIFGNAKCKWDYSIRQRKQRQRALQSPTADVLEII